MKIGVIGTFIKDQIFLADGTEIKSFGGIHYTLSILGNLLSENSKIYPVCHLGVDIFEEVIKRLSRYKSIDFSGVRKAYQNNTTVKLIYRDTATRDEILTNLMPPIALEHIQQVGEMDVWLVNFITGFEISRDLLQQFCQQQRGLIYMDFHSLSLDINGEGLRIYRKLPHWEQWIQGVDVLQMNDAEAATLIDHQCVTQDDLVRLGAQVIKKNIKIFHITCGPKGSLLFFKRGDGVRALEIPAHQVEKVRDVTGCGDAFAAGFLVHYYQNNDIVAAAYYANFIAGLNCTISGTDELYQIKDIIADSGPLDYS